MIKKWLIICFIASSANAQDSTQDQDVEVKAPSVQRDKSSFFSNEMKRPNKERSSVFWLPLLSYVAPGTVQYMNGQTGAGLTYSIIGGVGLAAGMSGAAEVNDRLNDNEDLGDLDSRDPAVRRYLWGMKTYDLAGSLSLYHAFRTSLTFRQRRDGDFKFLPQEAETTDELMLAPFNFSNLGRWTTILPLALGLGLVINEAATDNFDTRQLNTGDVAFATGISYNAGVGEEAMFRGWLFPVLVESFDSTLWGNMTQAAIFGLAHLSSENRFPLAQAMAGYYFGWLAQRNNWTLQEAIFVHTWWDIIVFTASFTQGDKKASIYVPIYQTQF